MVRRTGVEPVESMTRVLQTRPLPATVYRRIILIENSADTPVVHSPIKVSAHTTYFLYNR